MHKICLNHYLVKDMAFRSKDEKSFYWVSTDYSEGEPCKQTFAIRFKTPDIANSFALAIKDAQVSSFLAYMQVYAQVFRSNANNKILQLKVSKHLRFMEYDDH